jgi:hypothetical protein
MMGGAASPISNKVADGKAEPYRTVRRQSRSGPYAEGVE